MEKQKAETIVLGGGCFWCVEAVYLRVKGINSIQTGYAGGFIKNPRYEQVATGKTGHAEVIRVNFDPSIISFENILHIFFSVHDPTTINRQGNDVGTQYRSIILYSDDAQCIVSETIIKQLTKKKLFDNPVVTELKKLEEFYLAEEYHQNYFAKNSENAFCQIIIAPKIIEFRKKYRAFFKED